MSEIWIRESYEAGKRDVQATVQPLVDALEDIANTKFFGGWNLPPPYVETAQKALDNYRKAMGEK